MSLWKGIIYCLSCAWLCRLGSSSPQRSTSTERVDISKTWHFLGPFLAGKPELEGDPTIFHGGITTLFASKANSTLRIPSEIAAGGYVGWQTITASGEQLAGIQSPAVRVQPRLDWQSLVNAAGMEVLEFQGWAVASFRVSKPMRLQFRCAGVVVFYIHRKMSSGELVPIAGDIYHSGRTVGFSDVTAGVHQLYVKVRGKMQTSFACEASPVQSTDDPLKIGAAIVTPDAWPGVLLGNFSALHVMNRKNTQLQNVRCSSLRDGAASLEPGSGMILQPGSTALLRCDIQEASSEIAQNCPPRAGNAKFSVVVFITGCLESEDSVSVLSNGQQAAGSRSCSPFHTTHAIPVACRSLNQVAMMSFVDVDGSVQPAAVAAPLDASEGALPDSFAQGLPVILTFHGTGVGPRSQVEAYKHKIDNEGEYIFGVSGYWTLAPGRHGAHNWQGPGHWHARSALHALHHLSGTLAELRSPSVHCGSWRSAAHCLPPADISRVLFAGHSMGGAGAWHAATTWPDVAIAAAPAAGWLAKEHYGDANTLLKNELFEALVAPQLQAVLLSTVADQRSDTHASNLAAIDLHVRVGAQDATTHPFYSRRMARLAKQLGGLPSAEVVLEEVEGKEHWWWDTLTSNDGGVVNDKTMREFFNSHQNTLSSKAGWRWAMDPDLYREVPKRRSTLPTTFTFTTTNERTYGDGRTGLQFHRLNRLNPGYTHVRMHIVDLSWATFRGWSLSTTNIKHIVWHLLGVDDILLALDAKRKMGDDALRHVCENSTLNTRDIRLHDAVDPFVVPVAFCVDRQFFSASDVTRYGLCLSGSRWQLCKSKVNDDVDGLSPMREVFTSPFVVVVDEETPTGTQALALAQFIVSSLMAASDVGVSIVSPDEYLERLQKVAVNAVIVGPTALDANLEQNKHIRKLAQGCEIAAHGSLTSVYVSRIMVRGVAKANAIHLSWTANSTYDALQLVLPTIPPMYRSPLTNLFPDFVVADSRISSMGLPGILAAGYWGDNGVDAMSTFNSCPR